MSAPLAPIRRRTSWTREHDAAVAGVTVVPLAEPMPVTEYRPGRRILASVAWSFAYTALLVASCVFLAGASATAIVVGLALMGLLP